MKASNGYRYSILLVDDESVVCKVLSQYLLESGYCVKTTATLSSAREMMSIETFNAILLDLSLPDGNGIDFAKEIRMNNPHLAIIMITGFGDIPTAVKAMKFGVDHFLTKPVNFEELGIILKKSIDIAELRHNHSIIRMIGKKKVPYFGESPAQQKIKKNVLIASQTESPILLLGETGSGKSVLARWIHDHSIRNNKFFVEVNCSALRGEMLATELFGHKRGAFTSAVSDKPGLLEAADGGTLFLDEIGDMGLEVQSQILKVIEEKQFMRLGEIKLRWSNFRLIIASNKDLDDAIKKKEFREDLFFRINTFPIYIPPLRDYIDSLPDLALFLLKELNAPDQILSRDIIDILCSYRWPGNIRELKTILERALILAEGALLSVEHFNNLNYQPASSAAHEIIPLQQMEKKYILKVLESTGNDTIKAAKILQISRSSLYRRIKNFK